MGRSSKGGCGFRDFRWLCNQAFINGCVLALPRLCTGPCGTQHFISGADAAALAASATALSFCSIGGILSGTGILGSKGGILGGMARASSAAWASSDK